MLQGFSFSSFWVDLMVQGLALGQQSNRTAKRSWEVFNSIHKGCCTSMIGLDDLRGLSNLNGSMILNPREGGRVGNTSPPLHSTNQTRPPFAKRELTCLYPQPFSCTVLQHHFAPGSSDLWFCFSECRQHCRHSDSSVVPHFPWLHQEAARLLQGGSC